MPIQPCGNKILCRPIETDQHFPGARIILTADRLEDLTRQQAEIVAVGPGKRDEDGYLVPPDERLVPGAWIIHNKEFGKTPKDAWGDEFWLTLDDITAIIE